MRSLFESVILGSSNETQGMKQEGGGANKRLYYEMPPCGLLEDVPCSFEGG